jgi:hypothetical protein
MENMNWKDRFDKTEKEAEEWYINKFPEIKKLVDEGVWQTWGPMEKGWMIAELDPEPYEVAKVYQKARNEIIAAYEYIKKLKKSKARAKNK